MARVRRLTGVTFARFVLSFGGCGLLPKMPGTFGTAGAAAVAAALLAWWPGAQHNWPMLCALCIGTASAVTVLLTPALEAQEGVKDPQVIVTDEVAGYFATLIAVPRPDMTHLVAAFFLFRVLDILKPWPAGRLERLPSGWGVLTDDVAAGLYGAAILFALDRLGARPG